MIYLRLTRLPHAVSPVVLSSPLSICPPFKSAGQKSLASLSPSVAFALALDVLATVEDNGVGVTSATAGNMYNNYTFNTGLFMMLFDAILYTVLGWYFDNGAVALLWVALFAFTAHFARLLAS